MGYGQANQVDREMMALALGQARVGLESGGVPVVKRRPSQVISAS